ncbi:MAG TPA: sugar-transfer associated ATP-grasp domain-containing protein [Gemmatimonadaceae bacterium]|nr:sugar-transfer associated ATP-grasp domain-containing protein [Gemmatimonadaceae bacterium]
MRALVKRVMGPQTFVAARSVYRLATRSELQAPYPYSFKLWAWRRGFRVRHAALYDRARLEAGEYLTDYAQGYRCDKLNPIPALFGDKLLLRRILADRGFVQPATLALVTHHGIIVDPLGSAGHASGPELMARLAAERGRVIIKPEDGRFGRQISLVEVGEDGRLVTRRGRDTRPLDLARDAPPVSLVERAVEQHPFWHALSPFSVNTIRVVTMWTPGDPAPFIGCAVQRIGTAETLPTDNWAGGSVCARIDLATGMLGPGRMSPEHTHGRDDGAHTHHPDTGAPIAGLVLPEWARIKEVVLAAARSLPFARYVGWDVAIDPEGTPVFIEGNHNTSVDLLQVHGGLLADPAVRRFYEVCGVI